MNSGGCRGFSLPDIGSPVSDQRFVFAQANCERWNEMLLAITSDVVALENFDDGNWLPRVLPIYDALSNLLHPKYYGSLRGALVNVSVIAVSRIDEKTKEYGCYWQVKKMEVLRVERDE